MTQQGRRHDPYPWTWEIPIGVTVAVGLVLVLGVHSGRAVANAVAGSGWMYPGRAALFSSLAGVLAGDAMAGLVVQFETGATPGLLWVCIALVELLLLSGCLLLLRLGLDRWGPNRMRGVATRAEVDRLLGAGRLRKAAPVIRPDRYGRTGNRR